MIMALFATHSYISFFAVLAATLHEFGHIIAARILKVKFTGMKLDIFGASLHTENALYSYKKEFLLAFSGPAVNLVSYFATAGLTEKSHAAYMFAASSIFLAILNLLPIKDLDGGRMAYAIISRFFSENAAWQFVSISSFVIVFSLWTLSVYLILRLGASLSLFIFSTYLFCKIFVKNQN